MKKYYLSKFFYLSKYLFLIWYADDDGTDGFIANENKIEIFDDIIDATNYAKDNDIFLEQGVTIFNVVDMENLIDKIKNIALSEICNELLDIWNILGDMAKSTGAMFRGNYDDELTNTVYEKLFYGSNLSAITQGMDEYHPVFDEEETEVCISVFRNGLEILDETL